MIPHDLGSIAPYGEHHLSPGWSEIHSSLIHRKCIVQELKYETVKIKKCYIESASPNCFRMLQTSGSFRQGVQFVSSHMNHNTVVSTSSPLRLYILLWLRIQSRFYLDILLIFKVAFTLPSIWLFCLFVFRSRKQ